MQLDHEGLLTHTILVSWQECTVVAVGMVATTQKHHYPEPSRHRHPRTLHTLSQAYSACIQPRTSNVQCSRTALAAWAAPQTHAGLVNSLTGTFHTLRLWTPAPPSAHQVPVVCCQNAACEAWCA